MRRAPRSRRGRSGRSGPVPTSCIQTQCFDLLLRNCVACELFRTPESRPAEPSSLEPGTAVQPQESVGAEVAGPAEGALPLPALLFGAPAGLGLALALVLVAVLSWRWRRRVHAPVPSEARDGEQDESLSTVYVLSSGPLDTTAPVWPPPREHVATTPPAHSVPVPATELGSTELVTTKTAGHEQQ